MLLGSSPQSAITEFTVKERETRSCEVWRERYLYIVSSSLSPSGHIISGRGVDKLKTKDSVKGESLWKTQPLCPLVDGVRTGCSSVRLPRGILTILLASHNESVMGIVLH
ncbi:hypothetical protein RRG08_018711 [Elysia crispata]|uniref:Uncharacterized protein n=1 Tax=Elysia crispata TaxID=231223 RepID=A0AAE1CY06_9GAST|nr:hypothetical protein RRG08_018711 [Elysia crispata]